MTHFLDLAEALSLYPSVINLHLKVELLSSSTGRIGTPGYLFLYEIENGLTEEANYGMVLAETIGFPPSLMQVARETSNRFNERMASAKSTHGLSYNSMKKYKVYHRLVWRLRQAMEHGRFVDQEGLHAFMAEQRDKVLRELEDIPEAVVDK